MMRKYFRHLAEPIGAPELDLLSYLPVKGSPCPAKQAFIKRITNQSVFEDVITSFGGPVHKIELLSSSKRVVWITACHCCNEIGIEFPANHGRDLQDRSIVREEAINARIQQGLHACGQHSRDCRCVEFQPAGVTTDDRMLDEKT